MLFKFVLIIFLFGFILVSLLGFSVLRSFKNFFFGKPNDRNKQYSASQNRQNSKTKNSTNQRQTQRKRVIADNEGEYVDYEEIKD